MGNHCETTGNRMVLLCGYNGLMICIDLHARVALTTRVLGRFHAKNYYGELSVCVWTCSKVMINHRTHTMVKYRK
jgi:hypothetical protein